MTKPLKAVRESRGATKTWLASQVGVTRQTIHSWEQGRTQPTKAELFLVANLLNVEPEEISEYGTYVEQVNV